MIKYNHEIMFCGKCGADNPDSNNFCKSCGSLLKTPNPLFTIMSLEPNKPVTQVGVFYNPPFTLWSLLEQGVKGALITAILFGLIGFILGGFFSMMLFPIIGFPIGFLFTILFSVSYSSLKRLNLI